MNYQLTLKPSTQEAELQKLFYLYQEAVFPSIDFQNVVESSTEKLLESDDSKENEKLISKFKTEFKHTLENEYRRAIRQSIEEMERSRTSSFEDASVSTKPEQGGSSLSDGSLRRSGDLRDPQRESESIDSSDSDIGLEDAVRKAIFTQELAERNSQSKRTDSEIQRDKEAREAEFAALKQRFDKGGDSESFESESFL